MAPLDFKRAVVLISGSGTNLQALIDAHLPMHLSKVIGSAPHIAGLERAKRAKIPTVSIDRKDFESAIDYEVALLEALRAEAPDWIILAGFMRLLGPSIVDQFYGRIVNLHPSLLPAYPGRHTHARVLAAGEVYHGTTVHFVNKEIDKGPIIAQARLKLAPSDTETSLKQKILTLEHRLYPQVVDWLIRGRVRLVNDRVYLDDVLLSQTGKMLDLL